MCCVFDSVCELFVEIIRNVLGCSCYFVVECALPLVVQCCLFLAPDSSYIPQGLE